jgi:2-phospho-L-lactate/phosphoenolpyruvate guanylyltransferase
LHERRTASDRIGHVRWGLVVPVKSLAHAKTRLGPRSEDERRQLALAFARDTLAAALAGLEVARVVVVTGDPDVVAALRRPGVDLLDENDSTGGGLNAAILQGARLLQEQDPQLGTAALCADLPALRAEELDEALRQAAGQTHSFVADATGRGTTLLGARPDARLDPRFGVESAARHATAGAVQLPGFWPSLRRDVDDEADLAAALALGVGPSTSALRGLG